MCLKYNLSPSYCYKVFKCRCSVCKEWKRICELPRREASKIRSRLWRLSHTEQSRFNSTRYQKNHPERVLKWKLKKYGLTVADWEGMLKNQNSKCAICERTTHHKNFYHRLGIDHSHKTGKVRGLLCGNCNTAIGKLQESPLLLERAIDYLNLHKEADVT